MNVKRQCNCCGHTWASSKARPRQCPRCNCTVYDRALGSNQIAVARLRHKLRLQEQMADLARMEQETVNQSAEDSTPE